MSGLDGTAAACAYGWWRPTAPATAPASPATFRGPGGLAFTALLAFTLVLLLAPQNLVPALARARIGLLTAGLAVTAHVGGRLLRGQPVMRMDLATALAGGLLAWSVVSIPFSYWPSGSASLVADLYFKSLVVFWLIANAVDSVERLRVLMWGFALLTIPLSLTAVRNFAGGVFLSGTAMDRIVGYDAALTKNPNDLALMLNLVLPLCVALFLSTDRPAVRALILGIVGLHATAVVFTFSRAGFLSMGAGALVYAFRLARRGLWLPIVAALLVALIALPFLPAGYEDRLATISDLGSDPTRSSQSRWRDVVAAASFFLEHPIVGAGAGMDVLALNEARGSRWVSVHNAYLQLAVDLGAPGLVLFALLLWTCLRAARRARRRGRELLLSNLAEGIEVSLLVFAFAALFHPVAYQFYFFYVAGLALAAQGKSESGAGAEAAA